MAQKLSGVQNYETETRGESVDEIMMLVDLDTDLELGDLHLTSGCHDNSVTKKSTVCNKLHALDDKKLLRVGDTGQSISEGLCLENENGNTQINNETCENSEPLQTDSKTNTYTSDVVKDLTSSTMQTKEDTFAENSDIKQLIEVKG